MRPAADEEQEQDQPDDDGLGSSGSLNGSSLSLYGGSTGSSISSSFMSESGVLVRPRVVRRAMGDRSRSTSSVPTVGSGNDADADGEGSGPVTPTAEGFGARAHRKEATVTPTSVAESTKLDAVPVMNGHAVLPPTSAVEEELSESIVKVDLGLSSPDDAESGVVGDDELEDNEAADVADNNIGERDVVGESGSPSTSSQLTTPSDADTDQTQTQQFRSPRRQRKTYADPSTHARTSSGSPTPSSSSSSSTSPRRNLPRAETPPLTPHARAAQARIQAPQPVHAAAHARNLAPLELGLRA